MYVSLAQNKLKKYLINVASETAYNILCSCKGWSLHIGPGPVLITATAVKVFDCQNSALTV